MAVGALVLEASPNLPRLGCGASAAEQRGPIANALPVGRTAARVSVSGMVALEAEIR